MGNYYKYAKTAQLLNTAINNYYIQVLRYLQAAVVEYEELATEMYTISTYNVWSAVGEQLGHIPDLGNKVYIRDKCE